MTVKDLMTTRVESLAPNVSVQDVASYMKNQNVGILPVMANGRAIGVVTDRDIAIRCCSEGKDPRKTLVQDVMTRNVVECSGTTSIQEAADLMEKNNIRRLIVTDEKHGIVGILSLDDLAKQAGDSMLTGRVLRRVSTATSRGY